jgi:hypothetical protein
LETQFQAWPIFVFAQRRRDLGAIMWRDDLAYLFPLESLSSELDRRYLAHLYEHVRGRHHQYQYLEVGSYLGGTLTPALRDERCTRVLSIDLRPNIQPDARNADHDYSHISTSLMLNKLRVVGELDLSKLETFDGSTGSRNFSDESFQFAFIDAEHTDEAVFRDFVSLYDHLDDFAVCALHDTSLISSGVENILSFLKYQGRTHSFAVFSGSSVSAIFLDQDNESLPPHFLISATNWHDFKNASRDQLLYEAIRNRCVMNFTLKEKPVFPI